MKSTLEDLFTSPAAFGVSTASPLQRATCRIIEGRPLGELAEHPDVLRGIGGHGDEAAHAALAALPTVAPDEVDLLWAIRCGKTRLACAVAARATQVVDVAHLKSGEIPRYSIVSLKLDAAHAAYEQLVGTFVSRPAMKKLLLAEPKNETLVVRHPSGRPVEIACVAGTRAGGGLVARWSAGVFFDEFTRMLGSEDGAVVNYDDARRAVVGRLLPGAQIISCGSPWAPMGPAYDRCQERHGKPSREVVVIRGTGPMLHPTLYTPEYCERIRARDAAAYTTDVEGEFADPESSFISMSEIKRATREGPLVLPPRDVRKYVAACDPGTRGNAWTLIVMAGRLDAELVPRYEVVLAREWRGRTGAPLSPTAVLREIATLLRPYGKDLPLFGDQHSADAIREIAHREGVHYEIVTVGGAGASSTAYANRTEMFERLKGVLLSGTIELPNDPTLHRDLASVRRRLTPTGVSYHLPKTSDGRHADYVPALALALHAYPESAQARAMIAHAAHARWVAAQLPAGGMGWAVPGNDDGPSVWQRMRAARERAERGEHEPLNPSIFDWSNT